MNIIEKWKSRETKKKLREENIRLKAEIDTLRSMPVPNVCTVERNVQMVQAEFAVTPEMPNVPAGYIEHNIATHLLDYLAPFITYDIKDSPMGGKIYVGKLYVATGDKK